MFDNIVNWKLKAGSHDFPGPDGGTCVNEAAIVAAGFKYKKVSSAGDCPPCFSRPIAAYAIKLNDSMPDDLRQELLMPFVTRLSGTSDTNENEKNRAKFMALENCRRIMSEMCIDLLGRSDLASECRAVKTLEQAENVCRNRVQPAAARAAAWAAAEAGWAARAARAGWAAAGGKRKYYTLATKILDEAILMGNHVELNTKEVIPRLEKAKVLI